MGNDVIVAILNFFFFLGHVCTPLWGEERVHISQTRLYLVSNSGVVSERWIDPPLSQCLNYMVPNFLNNGDFINDIN